MIDPCSRCLLPVDRCICANLAPVSTRLRVLILQHPQEPGHELGSAALVRLLLPQAQIRTGLSWANLKAALGDAQAQPSRWAVLYLGSGVKGNQPSPSSLPTLQFVSRGGNPVSTPPLSELDGLVVLDGTWSQAKSLWWRNAWLLKLKRMILNPKEKSLYGKMRKEPRRECLSTLESVAEALVNLGEPPAVGQKLKDSFKLFLEARSLKRAPKSMSTPQEKN